MKQANVYRSLRYSLYLIFHPFKAFWDLKHEKMGNIKSANILYLLFIFLNLLGTQFSGTILSIQNHTDINNINIFLQTTSLVLPIVIWCLANWAITTLLDGEGTIRDIYITTAYALTPYILLSVPLLVMGNIFTLPEMSVYTFVFSLSVSWSLFLLYIGIMTIHQFTLSKTLWTIILSILGMAIIIAIGLLFISLVARILNFVLAIYNELKLRYWRY